MMLAKSIAVWLKGGKSLFSPIDGELRFSCNSDPIFTKEALISLKLAKRIVLITPAEATLRNALIQSEIGDRDGGTV